MRKESLKKNSSNGVTEDAHIDNDADINGGAANDADDADPLQGADQPALEIPKKKGRKKNDTVTEVPVPVASNDDDDGNYEVEDIIDHKFEKKVRHFLVRWKNCPPSDDTWEPESSLDCPDIVQRYLESNPDAEQAAGTSRKRSAAKEKSSTSDVPAKRSRAKNATSTANDENDDEANGDEEYEVEDIVDHKIVRGKTSFLIRWKNYDASGDTWEPESSLSCPEIIARYRDEHMKDVAVKPKKEKSTKPKKDKSEKEYEVQLIYDEKMVDGVKHYLVRWKGYKMDDDTWEPENSLNCPDLISKYQESKKNKRTSGVRGTPKKLTYAEVEETEGEDDKIFVNGSKSKSKSKGNSKAAKGKKGAARPKSTKSAKKDDDYEVESIVGEKIEKGKKYYFLKWKGWPSSSNTWELATSLSCPDVLKNYQSKQKNALDSTTKSPSKAAKSKSGKKSSKATATKTKSPAKKAKTSSKPAKAKPATKAAKKQVIDDAEQDWEVEKIVDVQYNDDGSKNFLIRWKGCNPSQDTWEPEDNVDSPDLIEAFMSKADPSDDVPKKKSRKA
ncbi:hypothetical protein HA402_003961 [Bradysia odoriphaga]|nr:hypothetical protein HA402_003961 [Bradysia odoriphaga]